MRPRLLILALMFPLALVSCSATMRLAGTAPAYDNNGTCAAPVLIPRGAADSCVVHMRWTGPATGEDSIRTVTAAAFTFVKTVPVGTYTVRAWTSDRAGWLCDTTITYTAKAPPSVPAIRP
jgi:hypothetical protein